MRSQRSAFHFQVPGTIRIFFLIWNLTCLLVILHILLILDLWSKTEQDSVSVDSFVKHLKVEKCPFLKLSPPGQIPGVLLQASILINLCPGVRLVQFLRMHVNLSVGLLKLILFLLREYFFWSNFVWAWSHDLLLLFLVFMFSFVFRIEENPWSSTRNVSFFNLFLLKYSWFPIFQECSKMIQFYICMSVYIYIHTHTYIHTYIHSQILSHYRLLWDIEYSFLC